MVIEYDVHTAAFDELEPRTAYLLWQLRESVFVVEQNCPYPELDGLDLDPTTKHVWVEDDGTPIGYLRILDDPRGSGHSAGHPELSPPHRPAARGASRIGRVLVAKPWRGRGIAEVLIRRALAEVGARPSRLDAQSHLADWYSRFGYEATGPEFLEDGIPHVPMRREG